jgi:predicted transcriptional regulator
MAERKDRFILRWAKRYRATQELGGKCVKCGEDDMFVLDFHHKDPSKKEFGISSFSRHVQWESLKSELTKCVLLCRKCHTLHHLEETKKMFLENFEEILNKSKDLENIGRPELDSEFIYDLLKKRYTINNIAKLMGKDPSTIYTIAERLGYKHGEKLFQTRDEYNATIQKINRDELIILYKNGLTIIELCQHFNCAKSTLYGILRDLKKRKLIK